MIVVSFGYFVASNLPEKSEVNVAEVALAGSVLPLKFTPGTLGVTGLLLVEPPPEEPPPPLEGETISISVSSVSVTVKV